MPRSAARRAACSRGLSPAGEQLIRRATRSTVGGDFSITKPGLYRITRPAGVSTLTKAADNDPTAGLDGRATIHGEWLGVGN